MRLRCLLLSLLSGAMLAAQDEASPRPAEQDPAAAVRPDRPGSALPAVRALVETLERKRQELREARQAAGPLDAEAQEAIAELELEIERLEADFDSLATGLDRAMLDSAARRAPLDQELEELVRPILQELKSLTEEPRELDRLRTRIAVEDRKASLARKAIQNITDLRADVTSEPVLAELDQAVADWQEILDEAVSARAVAQAQLNQRELDRKPLWESVSSFVDGAYRSKGVTLLQALASMLVVFLVLRFLSNRVLAMLRRRVARRQPFYLRLLSVLSHAAIATLVVLTGLLVFYTAGDWVLLGLGLLFVLGIAWAAKNALPRLLEEVRLLLNLGPVREGERILFEDLPWRVDRLSFYSRLTNPALSGGQLRLPLRDLVGLHSRPVQDKEAWFPCAEDDWVLLADGTRGKVLRQTPEMVQMVKLGGSRVTYRTADFLAAAPENLSANFRISVTFGIDYQHQADCTTRIPQLMQRRMEEAFRAKIGEDALINLAVEFKEAGASSLDYEALIDLRGEVAARYEALKRLAQRALVDACNENGWVIPFTQITLHQAEAAVPTSDVGPD